MVKIARGNVLAYASLMNPNYQMPKHLVEIAKVLHRVERGELKRVILTIPPRHGKSLLTSSYFPAWYLGRNPEKYIITSSYGQELSDDFGRAVRNQIQDPLYKKIFGNVGLRSDSQAASRFNTEQGGSYVSVGAGGAITGRGAHLFLIDDPIKNREDAESDTMRRKLNEWYGSVVYTRLMPGGAIVVIMQRWNDADLVGYLLKEQRHENWTVLNMPAISEDGKPLWPEQYPLPVLMNIKETVRAYNWSSQYQQQPISRETQVLDFSKITGYHELPVIKEVFTACDPAISKEKKACNTAFCTLGVGENGHIYDLETIAGKWSFLETLEQARGVLNRQKSLYLGVESTGYQKALFESCSRYFPMVRVVDLKADKDKFRRASSVSHIIENGLFHTNNRELMDEIRNFDPEITGEAKKDRVDAMVHCLHMVQTYALPYYELDPKKKFEGKTEQEIFFMEAREAAFAEFREDEQTTEYGHSEHETDSDYY